MLEDNLENQLNQEKVRQILSVYEALMGYVLCTWEKNSLESARVLFSLFKSYSKLSEYAKSAGKALRKKPNRKTREEDEFNELNVKKETSKLPSFKFSSTTLNLKCACRLLVVLTGYVKFSSF